MDFVYCDSVFFACCLGLPDCWVFCGMGLRDLCAVGSLANVSAAAEQCVSLEWHQPSVFGEASKYQPAGDKYLLNIHPLIWITRCASYPTNELGSGVIVDHGSYCLSLLHTIDATWSRDSAVNFGWASFLFGLHMFVYVWAHHCCFY